jgi:hypothetical protein
MQNEDRSGAELGDHTHFHVTELWVSVIKAGGKFMSRVVMSYTVWSGSLLAANSNAHVYGLVAGL